MITWTLVVAFSAMAVRQSAELNCEEGALEGATLKVSSVAQERAREHASTRAPEFNIGDAVMVTVATNQDDVFPEKRGTVVEVPEKGMLYGVSLEVDGVQKRFEFMANQMTAVEGLEYKGPVAAAARALVLARGDERRENVQHQLDFVDGILAAEKQLKEIIEGRLRASSMVAKYFEETKLKMAAAKQKRIRKQAFRKEWAMVRNKAKKILVFSMLGDLATSERIASNLMSSVSMPSASATARAAEESEAAEGNAAKAREDAEYALELLEEHRQNVKEIEPVRWELAAMLADDDADS